MKIATHLIELKDGVPTALCEERFLLGIPLGEVLPVARKLPGRERAQAIFFCRKCISAAQELLGSVQVTDS